ncbi:MAG TPA: ferredoxin reductase [Candidatus Limnocylindrales bacterium]|nr:ferredoxin reductase [Candidatus Limnocylindrales bacterium]
MAPFIDGLAYPLRVSHYAELLNPLWASHQLRARIEHFHEETGNARTLTLRPGKGWRTHRAGQHVRVAVAIDGRTYTRTYTISSAPERDDGCFTITVKAIAGGRVSPHLVRSVGIGDHLTVGLPQGDFHLPDARPVLPLFITAGSGITPARAMLASLIAQERMPETVHVHYAPREREVIFGQELRQLAQHHRRYRFEQVFTRQGAGPGAPTAHFHAAQLERLCPDWRERDVYACGPPALLAALQRHFTAERGKHRLHIERFVADFAATPADAVGGEVRFARSRVRATADQQTPLLRVAENEGMNPPHGCRMGICHSCDARLLSGCVRDLRTGRITTEAGSIVQPCVSAAAGDCELDL